MLLICPYGKNMDVTITTNWWNIGCLVPHGWMGETTYTCACTSGMVMGSLVVVGDTDLALTGTNGGGNGYVAALTRAIGAVGLR